MFCLQLSCLDFAIKYQSQQLLRILLESSSLFYSVLHNYSLNFDSYRGTYLTCRQYVNCKMYIEKSYMVIHKNTKVLMRYYVMSMAIT